MGATQRRLGEGMAMEAHIGDRGCDGTTAPQQHHDATPAQCRKHRFPAAVRTGPGHEGISQRCATMHTHP